MRREIGGASPAGKQGKGDCEMETNQKVSSVDATISRITLAAIAVSLFVLLSVSPIGATNGHILHAVGAIDSAMGGSTIAEPQDTLAPMFNNVGSLTRIPGTRVDMNLEIIRSRRHVSSTLGGVTGQTQSDSDFGLIPAFGVAYTPDESNYTYFIGALGVSGFGADYPEDGANPILRPQVEGGRNTGGFGKVFSFYQLLRMTGGVAVKLSPDLSVGLAPTSNYATLELEPRSLWQRLFPPTSPTAPMSPGSDAPKRPVTER
jgi:long-chain fatty acid transport protein